METRSKIRVRLWCSRDISLLRQTWIQDAMGTENHSCVEASVKGSTMIVSSSSLDLGTCYANVVLKVHPSACVSLELGPCHNNKTAI